MPLPRPGTQPQRTRKPAPPQRRKKPSAYRIFRVSRARSGWMRGSWRCGAPTKQWRKDVSDLPGIDTQSKRRRSRRRAWRDGLADQTVVRNVEEVRAYRAFERALVGSIDPRSVIELALVHRLASLLWRLRRASAIETGLFEIRGEFLLARPKGPSHRPSQTGTLPARTLANGHKTVPGSNGRDDPLASNQEPLSTTSTRPPPGPWSKSRAIAQCFQRLSFQSRPELA